MGKSNDDRENTNGMILRILYDSGGHYREGQPHPDNFWKPLIVSWISV
jgi:hypothetical protein